MDHLSELVMFNEVPILVATPPRALQVPEPNDAAQPGSLSHQIERPFVACGDERELRLRCVCVHPLVEEAEFDVEDRGP